MKKIFVFLGSVLLLVACACISISLGSKNIPVSTVFDVLVHPGANTVESAIVYARIPRAIFGILIGASLGISGSIMQSITRNPIADPSILGVNTGASLFVVIGMRFLHIQSGNEMIGLAFLGALLTALCVYGIASIGKDGASPLKLALAGAAMSTALSSFVSTLMLPDSQVMKAFRFWQVGSISGGTFDDVALLLPYVLIGTGIAILFASQLNALALGDEMATSLGVSVNRTRFIAALAGILLCAASTALAGPIGFVGLMVPHIVRLLVGADMRVTLPLSALFGSILLLVSDSIGRLVIQPSELEVGIITALLGAPIFILVVRKVKMKSL